MSFSSRIGAAYRALKGINPPADYGGLAAFVDMFSSGRESKAGQRVDYNTALGVATVFGILRVLCDGMAQSPLKLYREREDGRGADQAPEHPLYGILYRRPNSWQTSFGFRETMVLHLELTGNFFAYIVRVGRDQVIKEIWPLEPSRVEVRRNSDMTLSYFVTDQNGKRVEVPREDMWHVRGPSWCGWLGMEPVKLARESIGLSMAIEGDQAELYKNGLRTTGTYSVEGSLSEDRFKFLRAYIAKHNEEKRGAPLILDSGAKYLAQTMSGVDAQTIESRKFQVEEICRAFRVMPMMIGYTDKTSTYASAEQMFIAHAVHTLAPRFERVEQSIYNDLLTDADRRAGYYAKFNMNSLLRGAVKDQAEYFAKALGAGGSPAWLSQNEVRALIELNPDDDPESDKLPRPVNPAIAGAGNVPA